VIDPGAPPRLVSVDRRWSLVAVLLIVVEVALLVLTTRVLPGRQPANERTVWQQITAGVTDRSVQKQAALQAFSYLFKVAIPGVVLPTGTDGADKPTSGTAVTRWVQAVWDQLTVDQQAVINQFITAGPNDVVVTIDATQGATSSLAPRLAVARPPFASTGRRGAQDAPPADLVTALQSELIADIQHIGQRLGLPVLSEGTGPFWKNVTLDVSDKDGGNTDWNTVATTDPYSGHYSPCNVIVFRNRWSGQSVNGGKVSDVLHVQMTHEVIHCYQYVIAGSVPVAKAMPAWITEGSALWLAGNDTQIAEPMLPSMWKIGYFTPELALTNRSYDSYGWFALLDHLGRDLWGLMATAYKAAASSSQRSNAFIAVLNGDADDVRDAWAPDYLRETPWGDPWITYGFGLPDDAQVIRHSTEALPEPGTIGGLESRSNTVLDVSPVDGEIAEVDTTGLASVHDDVGDFALNFESGRFCVAETGCVCPANTAHAGENMAEAKMATPFYVALNAPVGGSTWAVMGLKLDDLCGRQPTPKPKPKGPGEGCADCSGSNGDPHMLTTNHYHYDFQAAGEFTLLRSTDGSLEIQARQEPWNNKFPIDIATNTAVAAKVNGHRVSVYATSETALQAHVDGAVVDATTPIDLGSGASVRAIAKGVQVTFPDGTVMWALSVGTWGINVVIAPAPALRATGSGLLGSIVKGGLGVPALPDGTRLPAAPDRHARHSAVYGPFADAWRVTDATSLFDYAPGKSTASYVNRGFPADTKDFTVADLPPADIAGGEAACASISDPELSADCIFDVAATGESGFADTYTATQEFYDSGIAPPSTPPSTTPPSSGGPQASGFVVQGAIKVTDLIGLAGATMGTGNTLYLSIRVGPDQARLLSVNATDGSIVHQVDVPIATAIHWAGGTVWASDLDDTAAGGCSVTPFDGSSLARGTTLKIACTPIGGALTASNGSELWYLDASTVDANGNGATLKRLKASPSEPDASAVVPFLGGFPFDSQGALFYGDPTPDHGMYRLSEGATDFEFMGPSHASVYPAGTGYWQQRNDGTAAEYTTVPNGTPISVPIGSGSVVGGDTEGVYLDMTGPDANAQLWRQPADGSAPVQQAAAPLVNDQALSYFNDFPHFATGAGYVQTWIPGSGGVSSNELYLQWAPLQ
jgi:hypothetical protein